MNGKKRTVIGVGVSSILLIFVILCIATFSVLSLLSARADYKLSEKLATHTSNYYSACNNAEDILQKIDTILQETYVYSENKQRYYDTMDTAIKELKHTVDITTDNKQLTYEVEISEEQNLQVSLTINYPEKTGETFYTIFEWKVISTKEWNPDNHINVYKR